VSLRVGVVSKWFNRGQPVVGRYVRSALDELGHETFVLARPKKEKGPMAGMLDRRDVWDQPGVTEASAYDVPAREYDEWVETNGLEVLFCDQNYQFEEVAALRRRGVKTIGRFVWEHFSEQHVEGALEAYDVIYSLIRCEQERYRGLGIESPYVHWGCHPELTSIVPERGDDGTVSLIFPGGFIGPRRPLTEVAEAFALTSDSRLRLLLKAQVKRKELKEVRKIARRDERIEILLEDQPRAEHLRVFASCDVCVTPSRWEGLGLPLYEATAFGMPIITNDDPPMNEVVEHELNGLLVGSQQDGQARSGIPSFSPDVDDLARAIERLADPELRARLAAGSRRVRDEDRRWERTVEGYAMLLERAGAVPAAAAPAASGGNPEPAAPQGG
jgi:1,2-diacylglycerol 3-alpha-glucosyltransferase